MADIKLNPQELLAQASEMSRIKSAYESLNTQLLNALIGINDSWSENIAGNFIGKIQSAKKSLLSIANMMMNGSTAARVSAMSFLEPNQILAGFGFGDRGDPAYNGMDLADKFLQILKESGYDLQGNMEDLSNVLAGFEDTYWKADPLVKLAIDKFIEFEDYLTPDEEKPYSPKKYVEAYKAMKKISEGDISGGAKEVAKSFVKTGVKQILDLPKTNPFTPAGFLGLDETSLKTKYFTNLALDSVEAQAKLTFDPSMKNAFGYVWNTGIQPVLDTCGDIAFNNVKYISRIGEIEIGEYYTSQGATTSSEAFQIMLGDLAKSCTGDYELGEYFKNYYSEHGSAFDGVYDGYVDALNFLVESGGPVEASKRIWKSILYEE
ncbi:MAG: hypothetical protein IKE77_07285 [Erysipelotrichaceae bacterium]|nr:hypothetical protein [Erysipelotrichaceae bacterium]